ncbi:MAG: PhnD/SsuA/transferrin family substrate-binding protein [Sandaracinaceae bacterium]|nr:PhnD/SsuA/transferrin family substrate-binding protein [Sandaracinaceae bacterium]
MALPLVGCRVCSRRRTNYAAVRTAALEATHDVVWAPPVICGHIAGSVRSTLTAVRDRSTSSSAALLVRKDGDIRQLSDLEGTRAAWVDKLSMGGYRSAFALLCQRGFQPSALFRAQGFCGSYRDAILAVAAGHAELTRCTAASTRTRATSPTRWKTWWAIPRSACACSVARLRPPTTRSSLRSGCPKPTRRISSRESWTCDHARAVATPCCCKCASRRALHGWTTRPTPGSSTRHPSSTASPQASGPLRAERRRR